MWRSMPAGRHPCRRRTSPARSLRPIHKVERVQAGTEMMKAGFIGLGTMGASMAANLQKGVQKDGHTVLVHDVRREAASTHIKNGAIWADSPASIAAECEIIFSSLPGPVEFEAVSYGDTGLLATIRPD